MAYEGLFPLNLLQAVRLPADVKAFLASAGLTDVEDKFADNGLTSLQDIYELSDADIGCCILL